MKLKPIVLGATILTCLVMFVACYKGGHNPSNENPNKETPVLTVKVPASSQSFSRSASQSASTVEDFMSSRSFRNHSGFLSTYGNVAFNDAIFKTVALPNNDSALLMVVPIYSNNMVTASLEVVAIGRQGVLPNDDDYAMNLVDLSGFDLTALSGNIKMIDVNYDNFEHSQIRVEDNKIISWRATGLSRDLKGKYDYLKVSPSNHSASLNSPSSNGAQKGIYGLCDSNKDHNISFGECYKCATDAISADGFSQWVCDFPLLGWFSCWGSKTAACVVVAAQY